MGILGRLKKCQPHGTQQMFMALTFAQRGERKTERGRGGEKRGRGGERKEEGRMAEKGRGEKKQSRRE